ncbi:MAG: hypothetical protein K2M93_05105 [Muribaculaceae bacterium]|nr:hypothetical protein [Muribaculaceae bacterium]
MKRLYACLLLILGLYLHEAFIFWGFPIYAVILLSKNHKQLLNWILACVPLVIFALLSIFKGNTEIAHGIVDSWNSVIPEKPLSYALKNSIGALGWETKDTFLTHLKYNINISGGGYGIILLPLYLLAGYYMFTNFLYVFNKQSIEDKNASKLAISLVYSLIIVCMIPMFTVLSCDTGRNFQYLSVVAFATFLIIPQELIISAFPNWYRRTIIKFNDMIFKLLPPNKGLMIIMLLFIGMSSAYFSLESCWIHSVIGTISKVALSIII